MLICTFLLLCEADFQNVNFIVEPLLFSSQICLDREDCHIIVLIILTQFYYVLQHIISFLHPLIDISFMLEAIKKMYKMYINQNNKEEFFCPCPRSFTQQHLHLHHLDKSCPPILFFFILITN